LRWQAVSNSDPAASLRAAILGWLQEAQQLRAQVAAAVPPLGSHSDRFAEALLVARGCQDRIEQLLSEAESLRHTSRRWAWDLEATADDAYDAQVAANRQMGRSGEGDYRTGRERQAEINLSILTQLQAHRAARRFYDEVDELVERLRILHRGIDGTRQDLGNYLRHVQWERNMER
jgi:hypothetical protein